MNQKGVVIIVPGIYSLSHYPSWIKNFTLMLGNLFKIKPATSDHKKIWKRKIKSPSKIIWMKWTRQLDAFSMWLAKRKLAKLLHHYKNEKVTLVGISLSGKIILDMLSKNFYDNISKVILVCSINDLTKIDFKHPAIINLYSKKDNLAKLAIKAYSPFHGGQKLNGKNIKNIQIPSMDHEGFCIDSLINTGKFKGRTITQIINNLL